MIKHAVVIVCLFAGACAGRDPRPVDTVRYTDSVASCDLMRAEYFDNNRQARRLARHSGRTDDKNVLLGAVGVVLFWPALFAMDLSGADRVELDALKERNARLMSMMDIRDCKNLPRPVDDA